MTTWIKLHDNFWENPKVLAAGEDAALLYIQGLSYCSRNLTDGAIPTPALRNLTAKRDAKTLARILVREGLWIETSTGWRVHDYLKVQRSREQVEAEREKARTRKAKSRSGHAVTPPVTDAVTHANGHADVTQPEAETEPETEQQQASDPKSRRSLLEAAAAIIGAKAGARPTADNPAAVAAAVARGVIRDRYQDAYRFLAADPALTAQELADLLEPPEGPKTHPLDGMALAQTVMAGRNQRRINGDACGLCDDQGVFLNDAGEAVRCDCTKASA